MTNEKTIKKWNYEMKYNDSFKGRVIQICDILQMSQAELKKYWLDSQFGLIYIFACAKTNKKLPCMFCYTNNIMHCECE